MKKLLICAALIAVMFTGCKTNVECDCEHEIIVKTVEAGSQTSGGSGSSGSESSSGNNSVYKGVKDSEARPGKIYYMDGTVSEFYDNSKTPVGIVITINEDGNADCIMSLVDSTTGSPYKSLVAKSAAYDAGCNYKKGEWTLPSMNELRAIYAAIGFVNNAFDNLIIGGYCGSLSRPKAMKYWSTDVQTTNNSYTYNYKMNVVSGETDYGDVNGYLMGVYILKIIYPAE